MDGKPDSFELCRILIQSQTSVFQAIGMALDEEQQLGGTIAITVNNVKNTKAVAERLEHFIEEAYEQGVVTTHEAESILAPVREHMKAWTARLRNNHFGMMRRLSLGNRKDVMDESYCFNIVPSPRYRGRSLGNLNFGNQDLSQSWSTSPSSASGSPHSYGSRPSPAKKQGTPPTRLIAGNLACGQGAATSPISSPSSNAPPGGTGSSPGLSTLRLGRFDGLVPVSVTPVTEHPESESSALKAFDDSLQAAEHAMVHSETEAPSLRNTQTQDWDVVDYECAGEH